MKKYIEVKPNRAATDLEIEVYYSLGGYNFFTGKNEPRGYYLSVSPVERRRTDYGVTTETYTAFSGVKQILKEVSRKSAKAEKISEEIAKNYLPALITYVCDKNGLEVQNPADAETPVKYLTEDQNT